MTPEMQATFADKSPEPDWHDRDAVIDHIVEGERPYAGPGNFDEPRLRAIAGRVFDRTNDTAASMANHFSLDRDGPDDPRLSRLEGLPTLVLHGTADPMFPAAHGRALADAIPGARLIELDDVGHQLPPPHTWERLVDTLIDHTRSRRTRDHGSWAVWDFSSSVSEGGITLPPRPAAPSAGGGSRRTPRPPARAAAACSAGRW